MDSVERIVKDAISKSSDGRIDRAVRPSFQHRPTRADERLTPRQDFLNSAAQ